MNKGVQYVQLCFNYLSLFQQHPSPELGRLPGSGVGVLTHLLCMPSHFDLTRLTVFAVSYKQPVVLLVLLTI